MERFGPRGDRRHCWRTGSTLEIDFPWRCGSEGKEGAKRRALFKQDAVKESEDVKKKKCLIKGNAIQTHKACIQSTFRRKLGKLFSK